jgi:hypothetical protein
MTAINLRPWISGPKELLDHADMHINGTSSFDHRIAFISIDNAVEVMIRTFLGLPRRARGREGPSRKQLEGAAGFGDMLDLLEQYADDLIIGIQLGDIEWFHRIRNSLYHEGNGITVDSDKLHAYMAVANLLLLNLFGFDRSTPKQSASTGPAAAFLDGWRLLHEKIMTAALPFTTKPHHKPPEFLLDILVKSDVLEVGVLADIERLRTVRDSLVKGEKINGRAGAELLVELHKLIEAFPGKMTG